LHQLLRFGFHQGTGLSKRVHGQILRLLAGY
jgi:hypothetical protein